MRKAFAFLAVTAGLFLAIGCASDSRHHDGHMPDPKGFNAHFADMDAGGDGKVSWEEFKSFFPQADKKVFTAIDLDRNGTLDHDEWHEFKKAHGLKHQD
jgi:hypothetical protein